MHLSTGSDGTDIPALSRVELTGAPCDVLNREALAAFKFGDAQMKTEFKEVGTGTGTGTAAAAPKQAMHTCTCTFALQGQLDGGKTPDRRQTTQAIV